MDYLISQSVGGSGGKAFDDVSDITSQGKEIDRVKSVKYWHDYTLINGIQAEYLLSDGTTHVGALHGREIGSLTKVELSAGEVIIEVVGDAGSGSYDEGGYVKSLGFVTNRHPSRLLFYHFSIQPHSAIKGFFGRSGWALDAIGVYYEDQQIHKPKKVVLTAQNGFYVRVKSDDYGVFVDSTKIGPWETFELSPVDFRSSSESHRVGNQLIQYIQQNSTVTLKAHNGNYVSAKGFESQSLKANQDPDGENTFDLFSLTKDRIAFRANQQHKTFLTTQKEENENEVVVSYSFLLTSALQEFTLIDLEEEIRNTLAKISDWVPENAENIEAHKEQIVHHILNYTEPKADSELRAIQQPDVMHFETLESFDDLSPCTLARLYVFVDVVAFAVSLAGLPTLNRERTARVLLREMGVETINSGQQAIEDVRSAENGLARAKACFRLLNKALNATTLKTILKDLVSHMSWWDWTKSGAIAVMQLTAWLASDGIAFAAEAALTIMGATILAEDAEKAVRVCDIDVRYPL